MIKKLLLIVWAGILAGTLTAQAQNWTLSQTKTYGAGDALSENHSLTIVKESMKIAAIVGRGTKKDFIDLFFLLKQFSLREILDLYLQKYPDGSVFIAMKSLSYFEDAEPDPWSASKKWAKKRK